VADKSNVEVWFLAVNVNFPAAYPSQMQTAFLGHRESVSKLSKQIFTVSFGKYKSAQSFDFKLAVFGS
jgi:hypothetical protein